MGRRVVRLILSIHRDWILAIDDWQKSPGVVGCSQDEQSWLTMARKKSAPPSHPTRNTD
jgi:hypothetical protein